MISLENGKVAMDPNSIEVTLAPVGIRIVEIVEIAAAIVQAVCVLIATVVACYGIQAWRREFIGKRHIELAENVLELCYRVRAAIIGIRFPAQMDTEFAQLESQETEAPRAERRRSPYAVTRLRMRERDEVMEKLWSMRFRVQAVLGGEAVEPIDELKNIVIEIMVAAQSLALMDEGAGHGEPRPATAEQRRQHEMTIWQLSQNDEVARRVDDAIARMEAVCRPLIQDKSRN